MSTESAQDAASTTATFHGGRLVARRLKAHGVSHLFTLSGGHLFSIYDGCREEGIAIVDVRHESTAAFAAEGWAKVTREPGVCALTAGPGVTNGMSAMASAQANHSPMVVLGGRAPALRWGQGSLQEIDHVPFVRPLCKLAATPESTEEIPGLVDDAFEAARHPHGGPAFVDFPLDYVFMEARRGRSGGRGGRFAARRRCARRRTQHIERAAELLAGAERPVIMAGTDLYWGRGEQAAARARRGAAHPRLPQRPGARLRARRPRAVLLARALDGSEGRRRGARHRRADGLPARLRCRVRRGHGDRGRSTRPSPSAATRAPWRRSATARSRDARVDRRAPPATRPLPSGAWIAELRAAENERRAGRARGVRGRPLPASPDAPLRRAGEDARPRRDRDRRRGRLRLLRGARDRQLPARAAGWTRARSAASAPARATRWRRSSRTPSARSC